MLTRSTAAEAGTSASGISTALDSGSDETGCTIVAAGATGASADADMTAGAQRIADEINAEHQLAQASYAEHAIRCGELLIAQRKRVGHGNFGPWIAANCVFARSTATRYMTAAKRFATGVAIPNLSALFPSGRKPAASGEALPAPNPSVQPAPERVASAPASETGAPPTAALEQALATIRRQPNFARKYGRLLTTERDARRALERAQVAHRNAITSILAAARRIETGTEGAR